MAVDRLLDLLAHRFLCFSSIFFCFSYSYVRQTKLASSLVNLWAHNKIVSDWLIVTYLLTYLKVKSKGKPHLRIPPSVALLAQTGPSLSLGDSRLCPHTRTLTYHTAACSPSRLFKWSYLQRNTVRHVPWQKRGEIRWQVSSVRQRSPTWAKCWDALPMSNATRRTIVTTQQWHHAELQRTKTKVTVIIQKSKQCCLRVASVGMLVRWIVPPLIIIY